VGSVGHVVHSGSSGPRNVETLFCSLGWDQYRFDRKHAGTCYAEVVFLHPVGYAGHIVHSIMSGHETPMHYFSSSGGQEQFP
jgi:hypothetical protein